MSPSASSSLALRLKHLADPVVWRSTGPLPHRVGAIGGGERLDNGEIVAMSGERLVEPALRRHTRRRSCCRTAPNRAAIGYCRDDRQSGLYGWRAGRSRWPPSHRQRLPCATSTSPILMWDDDRSCCACRSLRSEATRRSAMARPSRRLRCRVEATQLPIRRRLCCETPRRHAAISCCWHRKWRGARRW